MYIQNIKKSAKLTTLDKRCDFLQAKLDHFFWEWKWKVQVGGNVWKIEFVQQSVSGEDKIVWDGVPFLKNINLILEEWTKKINLNWTISRHVPYFLMKDFIKEVNLDFVLWKSIWFKNLEIKISSNNTLTISDKILSHEELVEFFSKVEIKQWLADTVEMFHNFIYSQTKEGKLEIHAISLTDAQILLHQSVIIEQGDELFFVKDEQFVDNHKFFIKKKDWTLLLLTQKGMRYVFEDKFKNIEIIIFTKEGIKIYGDWKINDFIFNGAKIKESEARLSLGEEKILFSQPINKKTFIYNMLINNLINEYCFNKNNIKNVLEWNQNFQKICKAIRGDVFLKNIYEIFATRSKLMFEQKEDKIEFLDGLFLMLDGLKEENLFIQITWDLDHWNDKIVYSLVRLSDKSCEKIWDLTTVSINKTVPYIVSVPHKKTKILIIYSENGEINQSFIVGKNSLREIPTPVKIEKPIQYKGRVYFFSNPDHKLFRFNDKQLNWEIVDGDFWFKNQTNFHTKEIGIFDKHTLPYCNVAWDEKPAFDIFVWKSDNYSNGNYFLVNPKNFKVIKEYKNIELFQWTTFLARSFSTIYWIKYPICLLVQETRNSRIAWLYVNIKRKEDIANILWKKILW